MYNSFPSFLFNHWTKLLFEQGTVLNIWGYSDNCVCVCCGYTVVLQPYFFKERGVIYDTYTHGYLQILIYDKLYVII